MKKISIISILVVLCSILTFAQNPADSIVLEKVGGGYKITQGGKRLNMNTLVATMQTNQQAHSEIMAAKSTYSLGMVVGLVGGGLVGYPLGTAAGGGEPNWAVAGVGAVLLVALIPVTIKMNKQVKKAVDTFNNGLNTSSNWDKRELQFGTTKNGIGLTLKF